MKIFCLDLNCNRGICFIMRGIFFIVALVRLLYKGIE